MRLDQEAIKLCYSTHRQQKVVRNDITYDVQPYSVTSIANILPEACRLAGIKRGVTPLMLRNLIAMHLPEQGGDLDYNYEIVFLKLIGLERTNHYSGTKGVNIIDLYRRYILL